MSDKPARYTKTAMVLHWLIAALILCLLPLGVYMSNLPLSPTRLKLYSYHKWLGVTVFVLAIARLAWRATHAAPDLPANMPTWQRHAAHWTHRLLYVLIFAAPISGWLMSSAHGFQTVWFGIVPLPNLLAKNKELAYTLEAVHTYLNIALALLVLAHIVAALMHHFIDRDDTLSRMLPFRKTQMEKKP